MTEETPVVEQEQPEQGKDTQEQAKPKVFEESYVKELRQEAAGYRIKAKELEQKMKEAEDAKLADQQKWQELAESRATEINELAPFKERYEAVLESISESNKRRIESIPENMRSLVPEYDDPAKLSTWLDVNVNLMSKPLAPEMNGNAGTGKRPSDEPTLSEEEIAAARKMGVSPKDYQAALQQIRG